MILTVLGTIVGVLASSTVFGLFVGRFIRDGHGPQPPEVLEREEVGDARGTGFDRGTW